MATINELTKSQLNGLTDEQKKWIFEDYIKANKEDIEKIYKNPELTPEQKKEITADIEKENAALKTQIELMGKKFDEFMTKRNLPDEEKKLPLTFGEFAQTIAMIALRNDGQPVKGLTVERVNKYKEMTKSAGAGMEAEDWSEGGALVAPEFSNELIKLGYESAGLINMARNYTVTGNSLEIRYIKDADQSGGYVSGGVMVYWVDKETAPTATKPATDRMKFDLKKLMGMAYSDMELIEDSPITIETMLRSDFADAFAMAMDDGMLNGTGAGDLLGVLNSPCLVSVPIEAGQTLSATPIMFQNINLMYAHLPNMSKRRAVWSINPDMTPKLPLMNLEVGLGGSAVFLPIGGASNAPFSTLYGRPIIENECCQALGTKGDIVLGDWSQYAIVRKAQGLRYDTSIHFKFDTDEMTFKFVWRMDGKPLWYTYKTPRRGAMTRTPFVTLDART